LAHIGETLLKQELASKGNTEGRRVIVDTTVLAYIAGFLDGDGSIFFQLVRRKDYCFGYQVRTSIAFYQKTENECILLWLKEQFLSGYIRRRKTGVSDYTIVDPKEVRRILELLQPYVRLKKEHVRLGLEILNELPLVADAVKLLSLCQLVDRFQNINYSKKRTITSSVVRSYLESRGYLAPLETDPLRRESSDIPAAKTPTAFVASEG
jgi:LAGLIDADG endonuclease